MKNINEIRNINLLKCTNCKKIIHNHDQKYENEKKKKKVILKSPEDIVIFTSHPDSNYANFLVKKDKITCKNCGKSIGYTITKDNKFYGVLSANTFSSKEETIFKEITEKKVLKLYLSSKFSLMQVSKRIFMFMENLKNFCISFHNQCMMNAMILVEEIKNSLVDLRNIIYS